ncbi:MAG: radical SAM protein [Lachnospiraceae bacterium]|nr:radical SAM protein [Lachnospiraceae bacterium]
MKWKNKGHEFDEIGQRFKVNKRVWIYGAGENGRDLFERLKFADCVEGFIDNGITEKSLCGKRVMSVVEFMNHQYKDVIVVVCAGRENEMWMMNQMRTIGYEEGKTLFDFHGFTKFWLPIFAMYGWDKLYVHGLAFLTTTFCNLRCKHCLEFTTLNKDKKRFDMQEMKKSLDLAFHAVDYVGLLNVAGGEAFLFQDDLLEIIQYIGKCYRQKIGHLYITTNGTIVPTDEMCKIMKEQDVLLQIDDYTDAIGEDKVATKEMIEKCKQYGICYTVKKVSEWIDLAVGRTDNSAYSDSELQYYFVSCQQEWTELYDGKLSNCNYNSYAVRAKLMEEHSEEIYDLTKHTEKDKMILLEYVRGYSEKGYFEMCKTCAGYWGTNRNIVKAAEQEQ